MKLLQLGLLIALASGFTAIIIYITGVSNFYNSNPLTDEDLEALLSLHSGFRKCVRANGLGLQAVSGRDYCQVTIKFPSDTVPKWRDPKTGELEGLSFDFNLCEAVATWEQVRNSSTVLTREFIDALPNGWEEYAWRRINKGVLLVNFWNDCWCGEDNLKSVFPAIYSIAQCKDLMVSDVFDIDGLCNVLVTRNLNDWELDEYGKLLNLMAGIKILDRPDCLIWKGQKNGKLTIRSFYKLLSNSNIRCNIANNSQFPFKSIWKTGAPPRIAFFAWEAYKEKILTLTT